MPQFLLIGLYEPPGPDRQAQFDEWFVNQHIEDTTHCPNFIRGRVYRLAGPHLGAILGVVQAGGGLGGAIGPFLAGWLFDVTNSYGLAFLAACVAVAGSAIAAWVALPGRRLL